MTKSNRKYLAKDFAELKTDILKYAKNYFPDSIKDFSEPSVAGLFLEMAAFIGDSMGYYLDHQFNELDPSTAVEFQNIERHAQAAGYKITGAAPATAILSFYIKVPATQTITGTYEPNSLCLPIIKKGTICASASAIDFQLIDNINFGQRDSFGNLNCRIAKVDSSGGVPSFYILYKEGVAVSSKLVTENFEIEDVHIPFRNISLSKPNISAITSVHDSEGVDYYEVESLSQDVLFRGIPNSTFARDNVKNILHPIITSHRYVINKSIKDRTTSLTFGGGDSAVSQVDIIPDPSILALPLYGTKTMTRFSIDPNSILQSRTMGLSPRNTTVHVTYRYGGGAHHNVSAENIRSVKKLIVRFRDDCPRSSMLSVKQSIDVVNKKPAAGGSNPPSVNEIKSAISMTRNMQSRIVTQEDLLARIYSLPSEFGSVYRASVSSNPNNPLSSLLYLLSRDAKRNLVPSPDALKRNLRSYLNEFRLISDAIDIIDAKVINYGISLNLYCSQGFNKYDVSNEVIKRIRNISKLEDFQIGQSIIESHIINAIINVKGVLSYDNLRLRSLTGIIDNREYSNNYYNFKSNFLKGVYIAHPSIIFELKYPLNDIQITV